MSNYSTLNTEKVCVGGVDLVNRHQLSNNQDRELQRFIDANDHLMHWVDEPKPEPPRQKREHFSQYRERSRAMSSEPQPWDCYSSTENLIKNDSRPQEAFNEADLLRHPRSPSVDHANYTTDFPGLENSVDNSYLYEFAEKMRSNESLNRQPHIRPGRPIFSNQSSGQQKQYSDSLQSGHSLQQHPSFNRFAPTSATPAASSGHSMGYHGGSVVRPQSTTQSDYGFIGDRPSKYNHGSANSVKRKGVSWLDERARSLSPTSHSAPMRDDMSQYGSIGNLSFRDNAASPAYSSLGKHRDDYNRFETQNHSRAHSRHKSPMEESRFGGFGDRPGSGVELTSHQWNGGEIITDPNQVPKGLKPRRMYYSPIGDGTVAADGYELKRRPMDLSPKVTITQLQHMERGDRGHGGVNIYEKSWSNQLGDGGNAGGHGSDYGPGSGRSSRTGAMSPFGNAPNAGKPIGDFGNGPAGDGGRRGGPNSGLGPNNGLGGNNGQGPNNNNNNNNNNGPHSGYGDGGFPRNGLDDGPSRVSASPASFHDSNYKVDTKTGYLITNPRELIHQYATTTPVAIMAPTDNTPSTTTVTKQSMYRRTEETTEEHFAPYAPYKTSSSVPTPNNFVRQLRDDTLTHRQREANQQMDPLNHKDPHSSERVHEISRSYGYSSGRDEIDALTNQLMSGLSRH